MVRKQKQRTKPSVTAQLHRAIETCGLTRYEIAKLAKVEQSALSRFMSGERGLTTTALDRLGELLDLEIVMHGPKLQKQRAAKNSKSKGG
jgi:transcriptional regulator with XRE-family HTH domain